MKLNELSHQDQRTALKHFNKAVAARIRQWDHEAVIEGLLGREVELGIQDWAAFADVPVALNLQALRTALGE